MRLASIAFAAAATLSPMIAAAQASAPQPPTVAVPAEVDAILRAYERAWTAKDTAGLAKLFTDDGTAMANGSLPAKGFEAIAAEYAKNAGTPLHLRPFGFQQSGDFAYVLGAFGPAPDKGAWGKFVLVLKKGAGGRWKIAVDMDNMNRPPAPPTPKS